MREKAPSPLVGEGHGVRAGEGGFGVRAEHPRNTPHTALATRTLSVYNPTDPPVPFQLPNYPILYSQEHTPDHAYAFQRTSRHP